MIRGESLWLTAKKAQELSFLRCEAEKDGAYRVARRLHAVLLNSQRHTSGQIAQLLEADQTQQQV